MCFINRFGEGVDEKRQEVKYDELPYDEFTKLSMTVFIARSGTVKPKKEK